MIRKQNISVTELKKLTKKSAQRAEDYGVPDPIEDEDTYDEMTLGEFKSAFMDERDFE